MSAPAAGGAARPSTGLAGLISILAALAISSAPIVALHWLAKVMHG